MFNIFGFRKDTKKSPVEKEAEGGFVIVGETVEEQRQKIQTMNITQPSTNVIVQPSKSSCPHPLYPAVPKLPVTLLNTGPAVAPSPSVAIPDPAPTLSEFLGDIPFTLAPHILAMQSGPSPIPGVLLSRNINLANFQYDFTLENSVLHSM